MNNKKQIDKYIDTFKKEIYSILNKGLKVSSEVFPVNGIGGVVEFNLSNENVPDICRNAYNSIIEAINDSNQKMFGSVGSGAKFGGTNISLQGNKIVLIKGFPADDEKDETNLWDENAAQNDVKRIVEIVTRSNK